MLRNRSHDQNDEEVREIHALTPPPPPPHRTPPAANQARQGETWENGNNRTTPFSLRSEGGLSDNISTMSRDFSALVLTGSTTGNSGSTDMDSNHAGNALARIGEEDMLEETNPLALVPDISSLDHGTSPRRNTFGAYLSTTNNGEEVMMHRVQREEIESKIFAWQTAKIAKINNRFKREDAIIDGWEGEQVQKSSSSMKKVERKLEEKRARALEKMQNEVAKAHRKAEERRASAEAKRGTKVARVLEIAKLMRAVGRAPSKRTFF